MLVLRDFPVKLEFICYCMVGILNFIAKFYFPQADAAIDMYYV